MLIPQLLTPEAEMLRATVSQFLARHATPASDAVRGGAFPHPDPELWRRLCSEMRISASFIPEIYGGDGFGAMESFIVFAELGRRLVLSPALATCGVATSLLLHVADEEARARWLREIATSGLHATGVLVQGHEPPSLQATPSGAGGSATLRGLARFVLDGDRADLLLFPARTNGDIALFAVERGAPGVRTEPLVTLDLFRPQADIYLSDVEASQVGTWRTPPAAWDRARQLATVALIGEQCGAADHVLQSALEYAKERQQFGRAIGSFQAVKHHLAEMAVDVESMWATGLEAARAVAAASADAALAVSTAKVICSSGLVRVAATNIQIHGGIGFTWEHEAHLYMRRAKSAEMLFGVPVWHEKEIIQQLADRAGS